MEKKKRRLNKKFRFQLLQEWISDHYQPGNALDVGGGKGLLAYFLIKNGWEATVVDPVVDLYLTKYKDIHTDKRVLLSSDDVGSIPRIRDIFKNEMAKDYDLLIGLHAHGSNLQIINAAKKYRKNFLLLPCCVIDEPIEKKANVNWFDSLVDYAAEQGFEVKTDTLNFKGQNKIIYSS